ncbi:class I SAM-dependent methyltransferase [Clostridioides difficile]|nr:class I SAM-dependent methyltransferase [Clostridioides difficile]
MKPINLETINRSFDIQAPNFESKSVQFCKESYLQYMLSNIAPKQDNTVLEVASGTCICSRFLAPHAQAVVCLDATTSMLKKGKCEAEKEHLHNMFFVKGYAEELPFLDNSFDIVFSRLAFHHFTDVYKVFSEMVRVLKPDGKLVFIDMEATDEILRPIEDELETLRDSSHVRNLSITEMKKLFESYSLQIEKCEGTKIQQQLSDWLNLTKTPKSKRDRIIALIKEELNGNEKTGLYPFKTDKGICFNHNWIFILGRK